MGAQEPPPTILLANGAGVVLLPALVLRLTRPRTGADRPELVNSP
jgi:hypothetical protein